MARNHPIFIRDKTIRSKSKRLTTKRAKFCHLW